jgi:hypothetical protein
MLFQGSFPIKMVEKLLDDGNDIIMISTYSNTVKLPMKTEINGETKWTWKDYNFSGKSFFESLKHQS